MARRKSTAGNSVETGGSIEVANTGLRPSWTEFWEAAGGEEGRAGTAGGGERPSGRARSAEPAFRQARFVSGGEWRGEWDRLGANGFGTYRMPHGVLYEGLMRDGAFEGVGVLRYPNGGAVEGLWHAGRPVYCQYEYTDGLRRDRTPAWPYCKAPDRRFRSEAAGGLKAADTEQLADAEPPVDLPPGAYDAVDGVFDPRTGCTVDPATGAVLRVPTVAEQRWIVDRCRNTSEDAVGFRPDLYENWWDEATPDAPGADDERRAVLRLILQPGSELDPVGRRSTADVSALTDPLPSLSPAYSRVEFDDCVRRAVREAEEARRRSTARKSPDQRSPSGTTEPGEWFAGSAARVVREISQKYLARGDAFDGKPDAVASAATVEVVRTRAPDVPKRIESRTPRAEFAHAPLFTMRQNTAEEEEGDEYERPHSPADGERVESRLKFVIDYEEYESDDRADT